MLRSAIPPPPAVVCQPPILQSPIQLTAAVVNQLSMIQSQLGTHPATFSQLTIPQPSILPVLSGHLTPSQPEIFHTAVRSVLPVFHQQTFQQPVSQQMTHIRTMPTVASQSARLQPAFQLTTTTSCPLFQPTVFSNAPVMTARPTPAVVSQPTVFQSAVPTTNSASISTYISPTYSSTHS